MFNRTAGLSLSVTLALLGAGCSADKAGEKAAAKPKAAKGEKASPAVAAAKPVDVTPSGPVLDFPVKTIDGEDTTLASYRGKALLVVNTASECGFTPQYEGLQKLYDQYRERGFEVLGFPCNDFGGQEPGSTAEIKQFCTEKFAVSFPMFDKLHAKGDEIHPLYKAITSETREGVRGEVKWNFTKFLVNPEGKVVARFEPNVKPLDPSLTGALERVLPPA